MLTDLRFTAAKAKEEPPKKPADKGKGKAPAPKTKGGAKKGAKSAASKSTYAPPRPLEVLRPTNALSRAGPSELRSQRDPSPTTFADLEAAAEGLEPDDLERSGLSLAQVFLVRGIRINRQRLMSQLWLINQQLASLYLDELRITNPEAAARYEAGLDSDDDEEVTPPAAEPPRTPPRAAAKSPDDANAESSEDDESSDDESAHADTPAGTDSSESDEYDEEEEEDVEV